MASLKISLDGLAVFPNTEAIQKIGKDDGEDCVDRNRLTDEIDRSGLGIKARKRLDCAIAKPIPSQLP